MRQILNPGQPGLPADPLSALFARQFITEAQYRSGRHFSALTAIARGGWNLEDGSVEHLYRRMVSGILGDDAAPVPTSSNGHDTSAADHARTKLAEMRAALLEADKSGGLLRAVEHVCVDQQWGWVKLLLTRLPERPATWRSLGHLKEGLWRLAEMERVPPEQKGIRVTRIPSPVRAAPE